jgi:hypothetical protein
MNWLFDIQKHADSPLSTQMLLTILSAYSRPYDKINKLVQQGYLLQLRKGLYLASEQLQVQAPEPFLIANHLYGPSYVSLDAALFYGGLIPERVVEITSVTPKATKFFDTPRGLFSYAHLPMPYYSYGIRTVALRPGQCVLMASPEKSLCDKIATTSGVQFRSLKAVQAYLFEDLRMEAGDLKQFDRHEMTAWLPGCPKQSSMQHLLQFLASL